MNITEAYKILDVDETISDEELKKKHRSYVKQYHPDVNKEAGDKLKDINAAYDLITDFRKNPQKYQQSPFGQAGGFNINIQDIFSQFGSLFPNEDSHQRHHTSPPPSIDINISFNESILGIDRTIKYNRNIKCETCGGAGFQNISNGCTDCNGFGKVINNKGNMFFTRVCTKCYGKNVRRNKCAPCNVKGVLSAEVEITLSVPPGTPNGSVLRLPNAGHYVGNSMFNQDAYGDSFVHVIVNKDDDLSLSGQDVISNLNITLLEALTGCERDVKTVYGNKSLNIPPLSKNKDELELPGCGVKGTPGSQKVILTVRYPDNIENLINYLKQ